MYPGAEFSGYVMVFKIEILICVVFVVKNKKGRSISLFLKLWADCNAVKEAVQQIEMHGGDFLLY